MKIAYVVSGAGSMVCGSCLSANRLARAVQALGEELILVPAYTPLRTDEENVSIDHVVFGGLSVYLQHRYPLFRRLPRWVDGPLDWPPLLKLVGRMSSSTAPEKLGPMTVAMLEGAAGGLERELDKMAEWLAAEIRPDVVHLSNVMLAAMAEPIRERLGVPVVCSLTGEDLFLERLPEPHYTRARDALRRQSRHLSGLIAMNNFYADFMAQYLDVPRERVHVIRHGLDLEGFAPSPDRPSRAASDPFRLGFLSRICSEKGLHHLVDAWARLARDPRLPPTELHVAGYLGKSDRRYLAKIQREIIDAGLADRFRHVGELDRAEKIAFLESLDAMAIPSLHPESKGIPVLEAWAAGTPVVLPQHGAYVEMVEDTSAGLLHEPNNTDALESALRQLLTDRAHAARLGRHGHAAIRDRYRDDLMAQATVAYYRNIVPSLRES